MMVGDPCPMHKYFHTILGLMDAHDPLLSCQHHGRNRLPWLLHELTLNPYAVVITIRVTLRPPRHGSRIPSAIFDLEAYPTDVPCTPTTVRARVYVGGMRVCRVR